jgi:hypothetical protein
MKKSLLALALALGACSAHAGCDSYVVTTQSLGEVPVVTTTPLVDMLDSEMVGYMTARPMVATDEAACTLRIFYDSLAIHVASEIAADECALAHVLAHEREHEAIYNRELAAADGTTVSSAEQVLRRIRKAQARHDSPKEYASNRTACGGAIARIMR